MNAARIIQQTERYFRLSPGNLKRRTRRREIAWPRHAAMYAIRTELGWSYPRIAREFGLKDHTTALHGCKAFAERAQENPEHMWDLLAVVRGCRGEG